MTMQTQTLDQTDLLTSLVFTPPCDGVKLVETCDRPAVWAMVVTCCGREFLKCDAHLERIRRMASTRNCWCRDCGHIYPQGSTLADLLVRIERI